jgi:general secretion pathway protein G
MNIYYLQNGAIMKNSKNAFTMVELVFVIVVLGILAAIAVPKMAATRDDAQITKGRADISSIRSAIVTERQTRLIKGDSTFINQLHSSATSLFDSNGTVGIELLMYGITPENKDGHWHITGTPCSGTTPNTVCTYYFKVLGADNNFTYSQANGTFNCVQDPANAPSCEQLTK